MEILSGIIQEIIANWIAAAAIIGGGMMIVLFRRTTWLNRILYSLVSVASILIIWHVLVEPEIPRKAPTLDTIESNIRDWSLQAGYIVERKSDEEGKQFHYLLKTKGADITTVNIILRNNPAERYVVIENILKVTGKHPGLFNQLTKYEKRKFEALLEVELINIGVEYRFKIPEAIILWDKVFLDQMTDSKLFLEKVFLIVNAKILAKRMFLLYLDTEPTIQESN